jgi:hypothetical protein
MDSTFLLLNNLPRNTSSSTSHHSTRHNSVSSSTSSGSRSASPPRRRPSILSVAAARKLSRDGHQTSDHLYDIRPVVAASERNARMNALVDRYLDEALEDCVPPPAPPSKSRRGSVQMSTLLEHQSESSNAKGDLGANGGGQWRRHSKRLSGIFRRG